MRQKRLPPGFRDEFGEEAQKKAALSHSLAKCFFERGYTKINTPLIEYKNVFDDYDLAVQQRMYEVVDSSQERLVIRPDLTLPIARFLANIQVNLPKKFYYTGDVFAMNQAHRGWANQVTQAGIELVGYASEKAELECLLIINQVNRLWLNNQLYVELSDARFAETVVDALGLTAGERTELFEALFNKNLPVYERLIEAYTENTLYSLLKIWPRLFGSIEEVQQELDAIILPMSAQRLVNGVMQMAQAVQKLSSQKVRIDFSSPAPQPYYTGLTFRGYIDGVASYIVSGGRYDKLLANFQKEPTPAVGMGFDLDVLASVADITLPQAKPSYVYIGEDDWDVVADYVLAHPTYSLVLADTLAEAREQAAADGATLYVVTEEGVKADA